MWLGGRNYFKNLLTAIAGLADTPIEPVVFTSSRDDAALTGLPPIRVVRASMMDHWTPAWVCRQIVAKSLAGDWALHRLLKKENIGVISHWLPLVPRSSIASVGWIADFQHTHLPRLFTDKELRNRDRDSMEVCRRCDKVIVSSESARSDLKLFAPRYAHKAEVLHFVASPPQAESASSLGELQARFEFSGPYFLLPNQFWTHKNHRVVLAALQLLKLQNRRVLVLATGATVDNRQPGAFSSLMRFAEECGVLDRFRVLGVISPQELTGLMHHAVALINPSHFEGWSTSVEESKSMGKTILLSDIPVHREQAPERGIYFPANDAERLAEALWATQRDFDADSDARHRASAGSQLSSRRLQFARDFQRIIVSAAR